jgi:hypothetical protein
LRKNNELDIAGMLRRRTRRLDMEDARTRLPVRSERVGFAFSSMERVDFTVRTLESMDYGPEFDLVWADGSRSEEGRSLLRIYPFRHIRLREAHPDVRGGPDAAIQFGLRRLLNLGYDYCGLIENDLLFEPGWFEKLLQLFELGAEDGLVVGAASVRNYESRILEYRPGYSLNWNTGAGMVLFSRPAAELILAEYDSLFRVHSWTLQRFYAELCRVDLRDRWELWEGTLGRPLGADWGYNLLLYRAGMVAVGSIPSLVSDLEFDLAEVVHSQSVSAGRDGTGPAGNFVGPAGLWQARLSDPAYTALYRTIVKFPRALGQARRVRRRLVHRAPVTVVQSPGGSGQHPFSKW